MNEQNEIEKLKRERDAAIEAGLKLAELGAGTGVSRNTEWEGAVENIKALRPKPERLRCLVNQRQDGSIFAYEEPKRPFEGVKATRIAVPMIEVRPLPELPEMEELDSVGHEIIERGDRECIAYAHGPQMALKIINAHNATVRAFKKWAEDAKREVEDE